MKDTDTTTKPASTQYIGVVHESEAVAIEVKRYLKATNQVKGRAYAQAIVEKMEREREAGRWK